MNYKEEITFRVSMKLKDIEKNATFVEENLIQILQINIKKLVKRFLQLKEKLSTQENKELQTMNMLVFLNIVIQMEKTIKKELILTLITLITIITTTLIIIEQKKLENGRNNQRNLELQLDLQIQYLIVKMGKNFLNQK